MKISPKKIFKLLKVHHSKFKYEKTFDSNNLKIKYMFMPQIKSDKLLIIFSGFPPHNLPATYNYISTFEKINCNRLYILDNYGPNKRGGAYYLGEEKKLNIEKTVFDLIEMISNKYSIEYKNITTIGTSKGGFAALYFAFKYSFGNSVVGAPQTLLGNYLKNHKLYFEYIAGEYNEENLNYLNELLFDVSVKNEVKPRIFLHVGAGEPHYKEHILPYTRFLEEKGIIYELDVEEYDSHSLVGKFFPIYAHKILERIL